MGRTNWYNPITEGSSALETAGVLMLLFPPVHWYQLVSLFSSSPGPFGCSTVHRTRIAEIPYHWGAKMCIHNGPVPLGCPTPHSTRIAVIPYHWAWMCIHNIAVKWGIIRSQLCAPPISLPHQHWEAWITFMEHECASTTLLATRNHSVTSMQPQQGSSCKSFVFSVGSRLNQCNPFVSHHVGVF